MEDGPILERTLGGKARMKVTLSLEFDLYLID